MPQPRSWLRGGPMQVIPWGGVAAFGHVVAQREFVDLNGVIIGKALFDEKRALRDIL